MAICSICIQYITRTSFTRRGYNYTIYTTLLYLKLNRNLEHIKNMALSNTKILFSDCAEAWEYIQGKGKQTKNNLKLIMLYY